jgi:hypothetical protein
MAATSPRAPALRSAYDCVVVGFGFTAIPLADSLSQAGLTVLHLLPSPARQPGLWLHPRLVTASEHSPSCHGPSCHGAIRRRPLAGVHWLDPDGQVVASLRAAHGSLRAPESAELPGCPSIAWSPHRIDRVELAAAAAWQATEPGRIEFATAAGQHAVQFKLGLSVGAASAAGSRLAIGGIYRGVSRAAAGEQVAQLFATQQAGSTFWLMPLPDGLTSLGLIRMVPAGSCNQACLSQLLEEALVACPALTEQLHAAQLLGSLHHAQESVEATDSHNERWLDERWLTLAEYEQWIDPIFASGAWLAPRALPAVLAAAIVACHDQAVPSRTRQTQWRQAEQAARAQLSQWYARGQRLPLPPLEPTAQAWCQELLSAQPAATSEPPASPPFAWEARALFPPRRSLLSLGSILL